MLLVMKVFSRPAHGKGSITTIIMFKMGIRVKDALLKITELTTNFLVGKQYFLVGKYIIDHLPTKLFSHNFPCR